MASVRRHGNKWQARISRKGCAPIAKSFLSKVDAERWSRQAEAQLDQGTFVDLTEAQKTTIGELIERYRLEVTPKKKGTKQEGYRLNVLKRSKLARLTLATTRSADIAKYRDERIAVVADLAAEVAASPSYRTVTESRGSRMRRRFPKGYRLFQWGSVGTRMSSLRFSCAPTVSARSAKQKLHFFGAPTARPILRFIIRCHSARAAKTPLKMPWPYARIATAKSTMRDVTDNHSLQRIAQRYTALASTVAFPPVIQGPRRTPQSLSLSRYHVSWRDCLLSGNQIQSQRPENGCNV